MKRILGMLALALVACCHAAPQVKPFGPNERVVFIGDSITHGGMYRAYIQTFYATRFPDRQVITFNLGIAGDNTQGGSQRTSPEGDGLWERDVRRPRPTAAVVMLGMNDAGGKQFSTSETADELEQKDLKRIDWFRSGYGRMLDNIEALGISSVYLVKPSPYDQTMLNPSAKENLYAFGTGKNDLIVRMGQAVIDAESARRHLPVVDFNTPMLELNAKQQAVDPAVSIIGKDRVHPGASGHMLMAYQFLKSQGLEGPVAKVEIDAVGATLVGAHNCSVENVKGTSVGLRFNYTAKSLPFPRALYRPVERLIPFEEAFNREMLHIQGLAPGRYVLRIDDTAVGVFGAEALRAGVNMALLDQAPQVVQANRIWGICRERAKLASTSRNVIWSDGRLRKVKGLDRQDTDACKQEAARMIETNTLLTPYTKGLLKDYLEYVDQYDEMLAKQDALIAKMYEAAQLTTRTIEVSLER